MAKKNQDLQGSAGGSPGQDVLDCRAILISEIHVEGQGHDLNLGGEVFERLVNSIREVGVLEPILVMQSGDSYQVVCGEHRLEACRRLGLTSIPARILDSTLPRSEVVECKMIENLNRADMNPIRLASCYFEYLKAKLGVKDEREALRALETYGRGRKGSFETIVETVSTLERITGKTSKTFQNYIRLLLLPVEIKRAIVEEKIKVSKGYIFSQYSDHPDLLLIFKMSLQKRMSKKQLIACLKGEDEDGDASEAQTMSDHIDQLSELLQKAKEIVEIRVQKINREEADEILSTFNGLCRHIEEAVSKDSMVIQMPGREEMAERNVD